MRQIPIAGATAFAAIGVLLLSSSTATQVRRDGRFDVEVVRGRDVVAREVLVRLRDSDQAAQLARVVAGFDPENIEAIGRSRLFRVRSRSLSAATLLAALITHPDLLYAEPNFIVHALAEPNDPMFPQLWGLRNVGQPVNGGLPGVAGSDIHASEAWDVSSGSTANVVAVVDTGIDYNHPDLALNMWSAPAPFTVTIGGSSISCEAGTHGFNAIQQTCDPMDDRNHGTHVSGTIGAAGDNGIGVAGINWTTSLMGLKFLDATGSGTVADAITAIEFAIQAKQAFNATGDANVRVLSNSWGGGGFSQALLDEINSANNHDMLFVAAAGNNGISNDVLPTYPASYGAPNVVAVAATTNTDGRAYFSNYGAHSVHLGAPGVDILSTIRGSAYGFSSGTSMATPHVSGAAALVLSRCTVDTAQLKDTLLASVDPLPSLASQTITGGRLNVGRALYSCMAPPSPPINLTAIGGDAQVKLAWSAAPGATSYGVKRSTTSGGPYAPIASNVKSAQYTDTGLINGTIYYYVVSSANALGQSGDSNEASASPKLPPDLVVSSFTAPGTAGAGTTLVVSVTTRNQGTGGAGSSTTRLYLSSNTILDPADVPLSEEQAVPELAPGAAVSSSVSVSIPTDSQSRQYYIIARADADNVMLESQESNNTALRSLLVGPDLIVSSLTVPAPVVPGVPIQVIDTTKNQGGGSAPSSTTRFYLSANSVLDTGDTLLSSRDVPALGPGASDAGSTTVMLPAGLGMGTYYLIAAADATNAVAEATETNNATARTVQVGGDLVVSALSVPAKAGGVINVSDTTTNQGNNDVVSSTTRFYLSSNSLLDASDALLQGSRAIPALGPGASNSGSTTLTVPSSTAVGTYYIIAKADADNAVPETQEGNNTLVRSIQVGGDLVVSALTLPSKLGSGGSIVVTDTTKNQGGGDIGASATRFYLSTDFLLTSTDPLLNGEHSVAALSAGEAGSGSTTVTIPAGLAAGSYYFFAKADGANVVGETQESNNTALKLVTLGPDLITPSLSVTSSVKAGSIALASDTVINQGGGDAGPSVIKFYLSADFTVDANDGLLAANRTVPALAAGASSSGSTSVTIPAGTVPGFYYVLGKADADGSVDESYETNNTVARGIQVTN